MCVCPLITAASHIGITKQRYQQIHRNTGIVLNFADFPKNASFKSYGVICLPRAAPASYTFFPHEISFYASLKPIATFSRHRQRACGRQRAIRWHRLMKRCDSGFVPSADLFRCRRTGCPPLKLSAGHVVLGQLVLYRIRRPP